MCGSGGGYSTDNRVTWSVSKDKKHISFYAAVEKEYDDKVLCVGHTLWCKEHCYTRTLPFPDNVKPEKDGYLLFWFQDGGGRDVKDSEFGPGFLAADYATFFASGTLENLYGSEHIISSAETKLANWEEIARKAILSICAWHTSKTFRFFIRKPVKFDYSVPPNAVVIYSVDRDTPTKEIDWAIKSHLIRHISVVDHEDNAIILHYLKSKIKIETNCLECKETGYHCFKNKRKSILIMPYQC